MNEMARTKKSETKAENQVDELKDKTTVDETVKPEEMSVAEYFEYVKGMKQETDSEHVKKMCEVCMQLLKKFEITGQKSAAKKAGIAADVLKKDLELYDRGITKYVHLDDVSKYLKKVSDHSVKIIELENFPREIPDDVIDRYLEVKDLFDQAFVVFTDYTEQTE